MLNPAAEAIHQEKTDVEEDIHKLPHSKVEKKSSKVKGAESVLKKMKSPKQGKRVLPDAPGLKPGKNNLSKSSEDLLSVRKDEDKNASLMSKYKYNSLPRKKKEKSRAGSMSTFYVDTDSKVSRSPKLDRKELNSNHSSHNNSPLPLKKKSSHAGMGSNSDLKKDSKNDIVNVSSNDKQTHIALYKFHARHKDEISFNDGDPIQVVKCFEDLWYEGINLLTGKQGIFPSRYVADILASEMISGRKSCSYIECTIRFHFPSNFFQNFGVILSCRVVNSKWGTVLY